MNLNYHESLYNKVIKRVNFLEKSFYYSNSVQKLPKINISSITACEIFLKWNLFFFNFIVVIIILN